MTIDEVEKRALKLIKSIASSSNIDISKTPVPVQEIAEKFLNLKIIEKSSLQNNISGIIQLDKKYIFINLKEPIVRRRFSIAHEIGHWALHTQQQNGNVVFSNRKNVDRVETEANAFGAALLMPSKLIYVSILRNLASVDNFETEWLIKILDLLPQNEYTYFNKLLFAQFFQKEDVSNRKKKWAKTLVSLIPEVAEEFIVSKEALSVRLKILGLLNPIMLGYPHSVNT